MGGVVSCSNGNSTQTQPTQQTVNTPTTTKDYTLTPTAQQGVIYNEVLNTIKTPTMIANSTPNYLPQSQLQQQQGLDVYAGGGLSAVITPSEMVKGDTINLTLDLSKDAQGITLAEFEKMGSLIAFEPNNSQTAITLTPDEAGMVEEGTTSPLAVEFNLSNSSTPVYINFPMNGDQLNFTDAYTQLTVNGVNIDLHVDLSPFNGGSTTQSSVSTKNIQFNQQAMDKYLAKGDYSKPFPFTMFTPSNIQNKYV